MAHEKYRSAQNSIYNKIKLAGTQLGGTATLESDVSSQQGAYIVAWRHPDSVTIPTEETSLAVSHLTGAIPYDRHSLHTTISDHSLTPNFIVTPAINAEHAEVLDALTQSVRTGLYTVGKQTIGSRAITFNGPITNGKSVITPGQANDEMLTIRSAIIDAAHANKLPLKGSWGNHMTVNRFTTQSNLTTAASVLALLSRSPIVGESRPTAIDVGYLDVSPTGFTLTPYERFTLDRE